MNPLLIETHELDRRAGTMKQLHREVPAPSDLGIELMGVLEGSPIELDLQLESVVEGIYLSGTADVQLRGQCARCLEPVEDERQLDLAELYFYPGREADEDAQYVRDEKIDLEPVLRDAVVLDLPFTPLCRQNCAGLCAECGANLNDDPDHDHDESVDPRWAELLDAVRPDGQDA